MRTYDSYKDSGIELIGEIPRHWVVSRFKYKTKTPLQYGLNTSSENYTENGIRFVRITDINDESLLIENNGKYLEEKDVPTEYLLNKYDVLFCRSGHTVGKSYLHLVDGKYTSGGYLVRLNFGNYTESKFVIYISRTHLYWDWIRLNTVVSTIENVNGEKYNNFIYPLPPLSEQEQIVSYLDEKTSLIDEMVEKKKRKIELLKEYRTSLINTVVTKGLNPDVPMKDSGIEWIGEIPRHWELTRMKHKGEVIIGLSYSPDDIVDDDKGVLVMRSSNVQNGKPSFNDNVYVDSTISDKIRLRKGDILICSRNGSRNLIGKNCLITENEEGLTFGVFMTVYRTVNYRFTYWLLNSPVFESQSGLFLTSTINQLTVSTLQNMILPYTNDIEEQEQIVSYLDEKTSEIDKTIELENKKIELLKEYRQSLISNVVTGKIKVVSE